MDKPNLQRYTTLLEELRLRQEAGQERVKIRADELEFLLTSAREMHMLVREIELELWASVLNRGSQELSGKAGDMLDRIQMTMGPLITLFEDLNNVEESLMSTTGLGGGVSVYTPEE